MQFHRRTPKQESPGKNEHKKHQKKIECKKKKCLTRKRRKFEKLPVKTHQKMTQIGEESPENDASPPKNA